MTDDIEFSDVELVRPRRALRPDENRHFAVVAYGAPRAGDLPIFVDLDVLAEMEQHAHSDTGVELGGVLLGGWFVDCDGRPFVVITDSLRAQHYESTRGSFKFTHDTWSAITRQREQFPPELQMVGWYHTHPGWGVFLSGMDLFICEHFFNKRLDVAYVIDPCRGDRGMFQWTDGSQHPSSPGRSSGTRSAPDPVAEHERIRQTGGFFVTASRFRAAELEHYVAELSPTMPATPPLRSPAGAPAAPIVHLHQPASPEPRWQTLAVGGTLLMQLALVALLAWRVLAPGSAPGHVDESKMAQTLDRLTSSLAALEARRQADLAQERSKARSEFLDEAFRELKGTEAGAIARLQDRFDQSARLSADVAARDAEIRELKSLVAEARTKLQALADDAQREQRRLAARIDDLLARNQRLEADFQKKSEEATALAAKLTRPEDAVNQRRISKWWWIGGGVIAAVVVLAGVGWVAAREPQAPHLTTLEKPSPIESQTSPPVPAPPVPASPVPGPSLPAPGPAAPPAE
jgi:proteasome lid subunit RPN8/RPN11